MNPGNQGEGTPQPSLLGHSRAQGDYIYGPVRAVHTGSHSQISQNVCEEAVNSSVMEQSIVV